MCQPLDLGNCADGVYILYSWIDGEDLEAVLPKISKNEQYDLGVKAGEILRLMHSIPKPGEQNNWEADYSRKVDRNIELYHLGILC